MVADIILRLGRWEIRGFIDDVHRERIGSSFCGARIVAFHQLGQLLDPDQTCDTVIAIGECESRLRLAEVAQARGLSLVNIVHPDAVISREVRMGAGVVVVAGAVINPGCVIEDNVIVNTLASVDHGCVLESGVHICPGVRLGGDVRVGRATHVGIGSTVLEKVRIGSNCFVGAASLVLSDLPNNVMAYGVPARIIRERKTHECNRICY